jgi:outer membrane protein assembly factor BamB
MRLTFPLLLLLPFSVSAADWPQFRGPGGTATTDANPPTEWAKAKPAGGADKNIAWTAEVPGSGWAQPVVVGDKVFVNTVVTDPPHVPPKDVPKDVTCDWQVVCLDLATGKQLWATSVAKGKPKHGIHPGNTFATETACADADRVYAFFGHAGVVAALDHSGKEVWRADVGVHPTGSGAAAAPALHAGKLFVPLLGDQKSLLLCLDAATGKELWRADQGRGGASWASPLVWTNSVRTEVVVCGHAAVTSHDPADGKELWRVTGIEAGFQASPTADSDTLLFGTNRSTKLNALFAVKAGASGDVSLKEGEEKNDFVLYKKAGVTPGMCSPLATGGLVYVPLGGSLVCLDPVTGKQVYKENLKGARQVVSSPVLAGGHLYLTDEGGTTFVVTAGREFELVATNKLDDMVWACPAVAGDRLLIRGVKGLYCIKK